MSLVLSGVAWADQSEGDIVGPETLSKDVDAGSIFSFNVDLFIQRQGQATDIVTWTGPTASGSCTGVTGNAGGTLVLPSDWEGKPNGTPSLDLSPPVKSTVTISGTAGATGSQCQLTYIGNPADGDIPAGQRAVAITVRFVAPTDTTSPVITSNVTGTLGNNGWYRSDVTVSWSINDPESAISSSSGCGPTTINADTSGTTLTCTATSAGGTASNSVTIKRDATAPTITESVVPPANGAGWNISDVTVTFTCDDLTSGIASCGPNVTLSSDGANQSATGTAVDNAGNSVSATVEGIDIDKTPPVVTADRLPPANGFGWNNSNVTIGFTCSDSTSGVVSCPSPVTVSAEAAGQSATGTATDAAGNSTSVTVSPINIDKTDPTISGSASPEPNANGWNKTDVNIAYSCADDLSGIASCGPDETLDIEGAALFSTGTAVDKAGNSFSATVSGIKIDKTAPSIVGSRNPDANGFGWNNGPVSVSFLCSDGLSDIASCSLETALTAEGAGQSVVGVAVDNADNSASTTVSGINIDLTAPNITGSASPAPNGAGWNKSPVTVTFSCGDALSGIDSCGPDQILSENGSGLFAPGIAVDKAGNGASFTVSGISIDQIAPEVTVTGVSDGETYILGSAPPAGCTTLDQSGLSGVKDEASITVTGGTSGGVGSFTATCSGATDNADNATADVVVTYSVVYDWNGFFRPIDNLPTLNKVKAGSGIPVKFSLTGNQGLGIFETGFPISKLCYCEGSEPYDSVEETVTAGYSSLSYDPVADQYVYVWKTDKSWAGTCRQLTVKLIDGTSHTARFMFTK